MAEGVIPEPEAVIAELLDDAGVLDDMLADLEERGGDVESLQRGGDLGVQRGVRTVVEGQGHPSPNGCLAGSQGVVRPGDQSAAFEFSALRSPGVLAGGVPLAPVVWTVRP